MWLLLLLLSRQPIFPPSIPGWAGTAGIGDRAVGHVAILLSQFHFVVER
jgi:hypothetical protein